MMRAVLTLCLLLHVAACGLARGQSGGDILVIGDSVMAWNRVGGGDIGSVIQAELDRDVVNRAALGARIQPGGLAALAGLSIPDQLSAGPWEWVVMTGGANDLGASCGCGPCDAEVDALISRTATTGAIPDLITRATRQGARVLWVGYYEAPESRAFKGCRPALVEIERRIAAFARTRDGLFFVDAEEVIDPASPSLLAADRTHPSIKGSDVIGRFLAQEIARRSSP